VLQDNVLKDGQYRTVALYGKVNPNDRTPAPCPRMEEPS
jgi:hypothetical protein